MTRTDPLEALNCVRSSSMIVVSMLYPSGAAILLADSASSMAHASHLTSGWPCIPFAVA
jgi:hypothetical protein